MKQEGKGEMERQSSRIDEADRLLEAEDYDAAFKLCLALVEDGVTAYQALVGWMYLFGKGTEKNIDRAEHWFKQAAERGNGPALWYLGRIYFERGDREAAIDCFKESVEQDYPPAMVRLAMHYRRGTGVPQDKRKAFELFEKAARKGHLKAQAEYAKRLMIGYEGFAGVLRGFVIFVTWFRKFRRVDLDNPEEDRFAW